MLIDTTFLLPLGPRSWNTIIITRNKMYACISAGFYVDFDMAFQIKKNTLVAAIYLAIMVISSNVSTHQGVGKPTYLEEIL